ncbi:hypothetical protein [Paenibacillus sp. Marseille-Q4541]|uniref:hypothetical protein n=1 Tax=Paenibacillus sp. Marseille-Q4541 TaxID=2831522 RepID=UPI001BADB2B9|nr:hypothetical protein [Paenibacillus sp. Marseille-Q4541]
MAWDHSDSHEEREGRDRGGLPSDFGGPDMIAANLVNWEAVTEPEDEVEESLENTAFDVDRMVNEGLGGGQVTEDNGYIGDSTSDALYDESEFHLDDNKGGES